MMKPQTSGGYSANYTLDCERVLVTLMRGAGAVEGIGFSDRRVSAALPGEGQATGGARPCGHQ